MADVIAAPCLFVPVITCFCFMTINMTQTFTRKCNNTSTAVRDSLTAECAVKQLIITKPQVLRRDASLLLHRSHCTSSWETTDNSFSDNRQRYAAITVTSWTIL